MRKSRRLPPIDAPVSLSLRYPAPLLDGDVATSLSFPTVWASRLRTLPADPGMARRSPTGAGPTRRTERGLEGGRRLRRICTFRVPGLLLFLRQEERERANQGPRTWDSPRHTGSQRDVPLPETASCSGSNRITRLSAQHKWLPRAPQVFASHRHISGTPGPARLKLLKRTKLMSSCVLAPMESNQT